MIAVAKLHTRKGGSASWGRPGDELLLNAAVDESDPADDSADELFATAFGSRSTNTHYDWSALADLTDEDDRAMDEIEQAMREDWLHQASVELAEVEDEGEEFFSRDDPARR